MTYLPEGFKSAMNGVRSDTAWKSSRVKLIPTECAIAIKCKTALVEPPRIMVKTCAEHPNRVRRSRERANGSSYAPWRFQMQIGS